MGLNTIFYATCLVFLFVLILIYYYKKQITALTNQIQYERDRRQIPFLNMAIDRNQLALRLINEGDIIAKDILIEDIETIVDVGFQKTLLFHFTPIDILKPGESKIIDIKILEKGQPIPPSMVQRMGGVLLNVSLTAYVHCKNMEGIPFCAELIKNGPNCKISRIALAEPPSDQ